MLDKCIDLWYNTNKEKREEKEMNNNILAKGIFTDPAPKIGDKVSFYLDTFETYEQFYFSPLYIGTVIDKTETSLSVKCGEFFVRSFIENFRVEK